MPFVLNGPFFARSQKTSEILKMCPQSRRGNSRGDVARKFKTRIVGFGILHPEPEAVGSGAFDCPFHCVTVWVPDKARICPSSLYFPLNSLDRPLVANFHWNRPSSRIASSMCTFSRDRPSTYRRVKCRPR